MSGTTPDQHAVRGALVETDGTTWYRIDGLERMEPFLTTVVSDDDLWMFVSSAGPLTAGRRDADHAVLPYETDDRLHRAAGITGPVTLVAREVDGVRELWRPFGARRQDGCTRALAKEVLGAALTLEETNHDWGLTLRTTWMPSRRYGWVRRVELVDTDGTGADVEVLDGLLDIVPSGVEVTLQQTRSNLVNAYKRAETGRWGTAAIYSLESLLTDRAEPAEALEATLVWSAGLPGAEVHVDERVVDAFVPGRDRTPVHLLTGRRGAYLLRGRVAVPADGAATWRLVIDGGLGHAAVLDRIRFASGADAVERVTEDVDAGAERLRRLVAGADGIQATGDPVADAHHASNVLFNSMRGGVFPYGHAVPSADLAAFVADRNRDVAERCADLLTGLPDEIPLDELRERVGRHGDPDLVRLVLEYLPLTFSRRHGDPSRPWNRFSIRVRDDDGEELLTYEGNWRDIFQNWEALLRSYPPWFPHVVAKFVNASTVDGYNPYRISRDGIDWEVPDPDDPWSNIGYWGDHQLVYLQRLLEGWRAVDPTGVDAWLDQPLFTYADVPYRLASHDDMVAAPRDTITFDEDREAAVQERVARLGADGRLVAGTRGPVRVTFLEKLLVPALAKLSCFVPGGGIWMNTQRPEWNDANNALAGYGLSMVTLYHLEQYLRTVRDVLEQAPDGPAHLSRPVAAWLEEITEILAADPVGARDDDHARRGLLDRLGRAATAYRAKVADSFDATPVDVDPVTLEHLLGRAEAHLHATIATARGSDGLYESYNLVDFPSDDRATVERLGPMLEGQAAAMGCVTVETETVLSLVDALYDSDLYRPDQASFLLYPATMPPAFLDRNTIPAARAIELPFLHGLVGPGRSGVLHEDEEGGLHFRPGLANAEALDDALDTFDLDDEQRAAVHHLYEEVFDHHAFTGRSSTMHGYEGIGSIYWHMVSKLLVAVQERYLAALRSDTPAALVDHLAAAYRRIREGLGFRKDPGEFGAVPTDCYSHTPAHAGAQQPGMTGQVKEQILVRLAELGLTVEDGCLSRVPSPLVRDDLVAESGTGRGWTATVCGTPVRVVADDQATVRVERRDGSVEKREGERLTTAESAEIFGRTGEITTVVFTSPDAS